MTERLGKVSHENLHIRLADRWCVVDATFDPPLAAVGAPVTEHWDGVSDCAVAVDALDVVVHSSLEARNEYVLASKSGWTEGEIARYNEFCAALNVWLIDVRRSGSTPTV
ncbi:MAG: hypothetical protein WCP28_12995 [Actinomycetes bacterium]